MIQLKRFGNEFATLSYFAWPVIQPMTTVSAFYRSQLELCRADTVGRDKILGPLKPSAEVTADELAAWILVGRALINLDEFISRE